ncbi:MAG: glycine--tRNA ligase subunit beta, partial [Betaproteobacteria bacterium]|nr:glycine--tRNA ligase subunit beta [Betaproteobacteria bacterium]
MADKKTNKTGVTETLLVELLTEELPPKSLKTLAESFRESIAEDLERYGFLTGNSNARWFATPRRLAVSISHVLPKAPDLHERVTGPSVKAPIDAVAGFARKHGVDVKQLIQVDTLKGKAYAIERTMPGFRIDDFLGPRSEAALKSLPIAKLMRWGDGAHQFVRPLHGLVMLHGSRAVPGEVLGVKSSNQTLGHRFLSSKAITLKRADDYERALRDKGKVIVDF